VSTRNALFGIFRLGGYKGKNFYNVVGMSCEGFEDQLLALFPAIEASTHWNGSTSSPIFIFIFL
jgi:hypothetical protein